MTAPKVVRSGMGFALVLVGTMLLPVMAADAPPVPGGAQPAFIVVRLPANAQLFIESYESKQKGAERRFVSPELTPGKNYTYTVKVAWKDGDKKIEQSRDVTVTAGKTLVVDFNTPQVAADPKPKTDPAPKVVETPKADYVKTRTFLFTYSTTVTGLGEDKTAKIWLPVPSSSDEQEVRIESPKELPANWQINKEKTYGNQILFIEGKPDKDGNVSASVTYHVTRKEVKGPSKNVPDEGLVNRYLQADSVVPIDGKPLELIKDKKVPTADQLAAAKMLYDVVNQHMKYDKSKPGFGRGDSVWACDSKFGNCTDFHSLFISLVRSQKIPAKFEIGFPLPPKHGEGDIGGYHCWAFFKPEGKGWIPVDISEANKDPKMADYYFGNLTEDRVAFSTGRDLELVPKQDGEPRNFLIYPYVEVDGKEYPTDKVKRKFTFKDLPADK